MHTSGCITKQLFERNIHLGLLFSGSCAIIIIMENTLVELKKQNDNLNKCLVIRDEEIEILREQIRLLKARFFGPKTEKSAFLLDQLNLFELDPVVEPESDPEDSDTDGKSGDDDQDEKKKLKKGKKKA